MHEFGRRATDNPVPLIKMFQRAQEVARDLKIDPMILLQAVEYITYRSDERDFISSVKSLEPCIHCSKKSWISIYGTYYCLDHAWATTNTHGDLIYEFMSPSNRAITQTPLDDVIKWVRFL